MIELLGRRPTKVVAVALANKMARIAWAVLAKGEPVGRQHAQATPSSGRRPEPLTLDCKVTSRT